MIIVTSIKPHVDLGWLRLDGLDSVQGVFVGGTLMLRYYLILQYSDRKCVHICVCIT